ncbi:hypothetical protein EMIT07CA2_210080 [Brevibacillus sp. IT-7CA2]
MMVILNGLLRNDTVAYMQCINKIVDTKEYLSGNHAILQAPSYIYNGKEFKPRKIVLQYAKKILNFSTSFTYPSGYID